MRRRILALVAGASLLAGLPAADAGARQSGSVSLASSAPKITYGEAVTLSGAIDPASAGETVEIRDAAGLVVASAATDAAGAFAAGVAPKATVDLHAVWGDASSPAVTVAVRAVVTARLSGVRLFGEATVRGRVRPSHTGERVEVTLTRAGEVLATRRAAIASDGSYETAFPIRDTGAYRARAVFLDDDHLRGVATAGPASPSLPSLREGSRGVFVELLEERLVELGYRLVRVDDGYDFRTADAVLAFRKVQGMTRTYTADASVWRALIDPRLPRARSDARGFHIEVDQTRQVLYTVEDGMVTNVIHVSTGAGGATRDGSFRVFRKIAGYSPNRLYYPSYFDGLRAIHGWPEVPTYPASHGCVRVPYWHARWIFELARYGTRILIYH